MDRRRFLSLTGAAAAAASLPSSWCRAVAAPGALPYTEDSFFRSRVDAAGTPVDQARTDAFRTFMGTHPDQRAVSWPVITGQVQRSKINPWGTVFHLGSDLDPVWRLTGTTTLAPVAATQGFHMADPVADQFPTGTQDRTGVVNDPVFGYTVQFADAVPNRTDRTINVSNAALFWHSSNGLDGRNLRSTDKRNRSSRGRIIDAMVISRWRVDAGLAAGTGLGHVLHMMFVETQSTEGFCHPMIGKESGKNGFGAQGERLRINPGVDLAARGLTGAALVVAKTLQEHGCYLGDNSGSSSTLKGQQRTATYDPYFGTNLTADCLKSYITWADFEVLPKGWP